MAELVVIRHIFRGGASSGPLERHVLHVGVSLEANLRRLFPHGFGGPWRLYRGEVDADCYLPYMSHGQAVADDTYVLVILPAGPAAVWYPIIFKAALAMALSSFAMAVAMRHRKERAAPDIDQPSPNNQLAAQTNVLRAGARVPDILGKVRAYPDLLTATIETWSRRTQNVEQWYVLGVGNYDFEQPKLGETPLASIMGATSQPLKYDAGTVVSGIRAMKASPEIKSMSLMTEEGIAVGVTGVTFTAATGQMSMPVAIPGAVVGDLVAIHHTASNDGFRRMVSVPASGPPYVYGLDGVITNEAGVDLVYDHYHNKYTLSRTTTLHDNRVRASDAGAPPPIGGLGAVNGYAVEVATPSNGTYRGVMRALSTISLGSPTVQEFSLEDILGEYFEWGPTFINAGLSTYTIWSPAGTSPSGGSLLMKPAPSEWYRVPLDDCDAVLVDIAFPDGLVLYDTGARTARAIDVKVEFRRPGAAAAQVSYTENFSDDTSGPLRFTKQYVLSTLTSAGLPAGTGLDVRCTRLTDILMDSNTQQYVDTTRWEALRAVKLIDPKVYEATLLQLSLSNTRSAVSLGETAFNLIATRKLPTWSASSGWSAEAASERWADALVERMRSPSGARKDDAEIDLVGIYQIQATLDAIDAGGDQGKISMTLDRVQDIDTELQLIASVARALVYRIGTKLYVSRDEGGKTPVALFSGRSKHPDGETLEFSMQTDGDPDAVIVQWFDRAHGWKLREYQFPPLVTPINPLRVAPPFATWAQAWRRSQYEWNRICMRRDSLTMQATEEALLVHPNDVIQVVDDVANLAQSAGEVLAVDGLVLMLDVPVKLTGALSIMLRDQHGRTTALISCTSDASSPHEVTLASAPPFAIKGRDDTIGTIYSLYDAAAANVRPWLVQSLEPDALYVRLTCANWSEDVYAGDTASLPGVPVLGALS